MLKQEHKEYLTEVVASDFVIDAAFLWLCKKRQDWSPNNDVWNLRINWNTIKPAIQQTLLSGTYRFDALQEITTNHEVIELWSARDALVLKAISIVLGEHLKSNISDRCYHFKGNGGAKLAVKEAKMAMNSTSHLMKSDIKGYYANIDHAILFDQLQKLIDDNKILALLRGYLKRVVYCGYYKVVRKGISLGCSLSPLMGAIYLSQLDQAMQKLNVFYARFMDDWIIIAPTKWKLRKAINLTNQLLVKLKLKQHPDKTYIGKASKGVDFLGFHITPYITEIAALSIIRMKHNIVRLYEQNTSIERIGQYFKNWSKWFNILVVNDFMLSLGMALQLAVTYKKELMNQLVVSSNVRG